jgi:hypothetical protein
MATKFFAITIPAMFIGLTAGWVSAQEMQCYRKPLLNGRIGETVLVCEAKADSRKSGVTVIVARLGTRSE